MPNFIDQNSQYYGQWRGDDIQETHDECIAENQKYLSAVGEHSGEILQTDKYRPAQWYAGFVIKESVDPAKNRHWATVDLGG
jgi:hypothetical protein